MDTDCLTEMAYECIRLGADASDYLKTDLGVACSDFRDEDSYLREMLEFVKEIEADPEAYLDEWNLLEETHLPTFKKKIRHLRLHIKRTLGTPIAQRGNPHSDRLSRLPDTGVGR